MHFSEISPYWGANPSKLVLWSESQRDLDGKFGGNIVLSVWERGLLVLKILHKIFFTGEGDNKEIVKLCNGMKFYWEINSKLEKIFKTVKLCFLNFLQQGEACAVPFSMFQTDE